MMRERVEEYLGVIYRLREDATTPVPLSEMTTYFGFSPVSVHEMIQKLDNRGWVVYHPYRGVTLTASGEEAALALVRRHRLWERFLTDLLGVPWDEAHEVAGDLEHVATESVTERLAAFLGEPEACPHGAPIPPAVRLSWEQCLSSLAAGAEVRVVRIAPETPDLLKRIAGEGLLPGCQVKILNQDSHSMLLALRESGDEVRVPMDDAVSIYVEVI